MDSKFLEASVWELIVLMATLTWFVSFPSFSQGKCTLLKSWPLNLRLILISLRFTPYVRFILFSWRKCTIDKALLLLSSDRFVECVYSHGFIEIKSTIFWRLNERQSCLRQLKGSPKYQWLSNKFVPQEKY